MCSQVSVAKSEYSPLSLVPEFTQQLSSLPIRTSVFGSATGRFFSNTACTSVKIAAFAPMPSASVRTAVMVKPGVLRNCRSA